MDNVLFGKFLTLVLFLFGIIFFFLLAYGDGNPFWIVKKMTCRLGMHKVYRKIGKLKIHRYYCEHCKKPRKHPELKIVDGGKKIGNNLFRF
jgi:hypothetical protein